ncbi:MAG TPA: hypothetical protein VFH51_12680, partial [Myxococcota bacterium]|nr:hypothetical protein [Myxococcota bacterium]
MGPDDTWAARYGIRSRIILAFGALAMCVALGSVIIRETHERAHHSLERVEELEAGVRAALRLSAAVRDQY